MARAPGRPVTTDLVTLDATDLDDGPETGPLRRCVVTRAVLPKDQMIRFVLGPDRMIVPDLAARLPGRGMWLSASADVILSGSASDGGARDFGPASPDRRPQVDVNGHDGSLGGDSLQGDRHPAPASGSVPASGDAPQRIVGGDGSGGQRRHGLSRGSQAADKVLTRAFARAARGPVTLPPDLPGLLRTGLRQRVTASLGLARRAGQAVAGFEKAREMVVAGRAALLVQASDGSPAERARFLSAAGRDRASALAVIDPLPGAELGRVFGREHVVHVAIAPGKLADSLAVDAGRLAGLTKRSIGTTERVAPMNDVAGTDE